MNKTDLSWRLMEDICERTNVKHTFGVYSENKVTGKYVAREIIAAYLTCDGNHGGGRCGDPGCWDQNVEVRPGHPGGDLITTGTLDRLRKLRLWHWGQVLYWRELQRRANDTADRLADRWTLAAPWAKLANERAGHAMQHLSAVQLLNEFFPIGDTAEVDHARAHPTAE